MTKYRRKPGQPIEAERFLQGGDLPRGVITNAAGLEPYVVTIHGHATPVADGDWILPEPDGVHYYPVKPQIFERTYDEVVDDIDMDDAAELFDKPINGPKGPAIIMACDVDEELMPSERYTRFRDALQDLINEHSMENGSDTPDFMLAEFLTDALMSFDRLMQRRDGWYGASHRQLKAQLEAEGAHTAAATALADEMQRAIDKSLLDEQ